MRGNYGWLALLTMACGSAASPAKEPATASVATETTDTTAPDSAEGEKSASTTAPPEPAPAATSESATTTLSPSDLTSVLQITLDDPELTGYLHTEKHGRVPVKLSGPDLPKDLKLQKGNYAVTIVDGAKGAKDPVLVLNHVRLEGNIATVVYSYDVEGVRGTTKVKNGKSGWELLSSRISQKE